MPPSTGQLLADLLGALNDHDVTRVASLHALDYEGVDVGSASPQRGPDGARQALLRYLAAFPDLRFTADDLAVSENRAMVLWTARGTHQGSLMHIPPTGRAVDVRGASLFTVEHGKIARLTTVWDVAGLLRELGLLPDL